MLSRKSFGNLALWIFYLHFNKRNMAKKQKDFSWLDDSASSQEVITQDSNWATLQNWDNVRAIKDIKVSWASDIKRGDIFKNIRLTDDSTLIESWKMVLKTEFFKKQ